MADSFLDEAIDRGRRCGSIDERIERATGRTTVVELHHGYALRRYIHRWYLGCGKAAPGSIVERSASRWGYTLAKAVSPPDDVCALIEFGDQAARAATLPATWPNGFPRFTPGFMHAAP